MTCSHEFNVTTKDRESAKYCSRKCYNESHEKEFNKICKYCNNPIRYRLGGNGRIFCSIRCSVRYRNSIRALI